MFVEVQHFNLCPTFAGKATKFCLAKEKLTGSNILPDFFQFKTLQLIESMMTKKVFCPLETVQLTFTHFHTRTQKVC